MKAVLIDHDDSFTYNLRHWLKPLFAQIDVLNHRDFLKTDTSNYTLVILSPGPKHPSDYPQTLQWLQTIGNKQAVYGVCLGLQMMAHSLDISVKPYAPPLHGKTSKLDTLDCEVARYHSLFCDFESEEKNFEILARSTDDRLPMWVQHRQKKWMGVQFHPESFLTEKADEHLAFLQTWLQR